MTEGTERTFGRTSVDLITGWQTSLLVWIGGLSLIVGGIMPFACADVANGVSLFKKERFLDDGTEDPEAEWQFCGKHFTHQIAITSICFGEELDEND